MKLKELKEVYYFKEIAPKDTEMRIEVISWSQERFVGLCFLDLESETFSQHHCHNKLSTFFDFERFFENLKKRPDRVFRFLLKSLPYMRDNGNNFILNFY